MTDSHDPQRRFELNSRLMMSGIVLIVIGGLLGWIGMALGSTALITASRRWVKQMEIPPSEVAKQQWERAKVATAAGVNAWRNEVGQESAHSQK